LILIGADEVGRGCIWGPVVVAATAVLPEDVRVENVRDSKVVKSEKVRGRLADKIRNSHLCVVTSAKSSVVDLIGINAAQKACTSSALIQIIAQLRSSGITDIIHITLDGKEVSGSQYGPFPAGETLGSSYYIKHVPHADADVYEVSAASLVAKSYRDSWCRQFAVDHPIITEYGIESNFGYGSDKHDSAIRRLGLTPQHRRTFCRKYIAAGEINVPTAAIAG
jgi:ribonuclease HII